jgi:hypothetical protein
VPQFEWRFYRYDKLISHNQAIFSRDNVKVVLVEELARNPRHLFAEVDTFTRISSAPFSREREVFNPGLEDKYIERTRFVNVLFSLIGKDLSRLGYET